MSERAGALGRLRTLSRPEVMEGLRNRRQLVVRAVTPLVLLLTLSAVFALTHQTQRLADDDYEIAVEGDMAGAEQTLAGLVQPPTLAGTGTPTLTFIASTDAALAVTHTADVGLIVPEELDSTLAADATATLSIYTDARERPSRAAASLLRAALFERLSPLAGEVALEVDDVTAAEEDSDTVGRARDDLGRVVGAYVLLQGAVLVGTAAIRLTGRRATGNLVPQLLLPVTRFELITSRAVSELELGMLTGFPLLGLVTLLTAIVLIADGAATTALATVLVIPIAAAAIAAPLICTGLVIGIRARSPQQVSGLTAGSLVLVSLAARFVSRVGEDPPAYLAAIPLIGPAHVVRQTIDGQFDPTELLVALVSTVVLGWLILRFASSMMGREHLALRSV